MNKQFYIFNMVGWLFGLTVLTIGVLNLILIHPVPGIVYFLFSLIFLPPVNVVLRKRFGFSIPVVIKIVLGIIIVWFTLGISDLAELYGFLCG